MQGINGQLTGSARSIATRKTSFRINRNNGPTRSAGVAPHHQAGITHPPLVSRNERRGSENDARDAVLGNGMSPSFARSCSERRTERPSDWQRQYHWSLDHHARSQELVHGVGMSSCCQNRSSYCFNFLLFFSSLRISRFL